MGQGRELACWNSPLMAPTVRNDSDLDEVLIKKICISQKALKALFSSK